MPARQVAHGFGLEPETGVRSQDQIQRILPHSTAILLTADPAAARCDGPSHSGTGESTFQSKRHAMTKGEAGENDAFARALVLYTRAILLSLHARALFHFERAHAAGHARDGKAGRESAEALWPDSARAWFWASFAFVDALDTREAIRAYHRSIEIDPSDARAYRNLAAVLQYSGNTSELIAIDPEDAAAHLSLGKVLEASGDLPSASEQYLRAIEIDGGLLAPHFALGDARLKSRDWAQAAEQFPRGIDIDGKSANAHFGLVAALADYGNRRDAMVRYRLAIDLDGNLIVAHVALGNTLIASQELSEAIAECNRAIDIDPNSALAHGTLGGAYLNSRRLPDAIAECKRAIAIDSKDAVARLNLGSA